jgi:thiamine pyrophosphokinase
MRALIVADSPLAVTAEALASLAKLSDLIVAADGAASRCLAAGVEPDIVVGDLDSLEPADEKRLRALEVSFEVVPAEKDDSDLDLAIDAARRLGATSVVAVGVLGGRVDHELAALGTLARAADLAPRLITSEASAFVLSPQGRSAFQIEGPAVFSLMSLLGTAEVSCAGSRWTLTKARLEPISSLGLSNRVPDGSVAEIAVFEGVVLLYLL